MRAVIKLYEHPDLSAEDVSSYKAAVRTNSRVLALAVSSLVFGSTFGVWWLGPGYFHSKDNVLSSV
ncbi:hypothetical protein BD410DRAFT_794934 [Rickenella mellea]|uniref:Uncharacterized protein n=1 Tax=Rickenella mellea TaxID=50990 RepID=A0A4Y7PN08_9AGAM|nr:hypothetical protein BD410DRAFT_794934 [Rickenella mellea]